VLEVVLRLEIKSQPAPGHGGRRGISRGHLSCPNQDQSSKDWDNNIKRSRRRQEKENKEPGSLVLSRSRPTDEKKEMERRP